MKLHTCDLVVMWNTTFKFQLDRTHGLEARIITFLDPRGGSLSLTRVVVLHLLLVDFFVSQPTVFIETS